MKKQTINTQRKRVNDCSQKDSSGNTVQFPQPNELTKIKDSKTGMNLFKEIEGKVGDT